MTVFWLNKSLCLMRPEAHFGQHRALETKYHLVRLNNLNEL